MLFLFFINCQVELLFLLLFVFLLIFGYKSLLLRQFFQSQIHFVPCCCLLTIFRWFIQANFGQEILILLRLFLIFLLINKNLLCFCYFFQFQNQDSHQINCLALTVSLLVYLKFTNRRNHHYFCSNYFFVMLIYKILFWYLFAWLLFIVILFSIFFLKIVEIKLVHLFFALGGYLKMKNFISFVFL